jgi:hypothetical protein
MHLCGCAATAQNTGMLLSAAGYIFMSVVHSIPGCFGAVRDPYLQTIID